MCYNIVETAMFFIPKLVDCQTFLIFAVIFLALSYVFSTRLPPNFPPGPKPLPIIGNLAIFAKDLNKTPQILTELSQHYGHVVGIKLGSYPAVILNGYEAIKEAFVKNADSFSGRPKFMVILNELFKQRGVVLSHGKLWRLSKRFTLSNLRDFGMGKRNIEARIQQEAVEVCQEIEKHSGNPFKLKILLHQSFSNIICSICFGKRFDYKDKVFIQLMDIITTLATSNVFISPLNFIPMLGLLIKLGYADSTLNIVQPLDEWIKKRIEDHRDTFDGVNIRDFADVYLKEEQSGIKSDLEITNIVYIMRDLFIAGTETTSTSLQWLLLIMLHFPEVQQKCHEELDANIGERCASLSDREKLPFLEAVIHESQRFRTVLPLGLVHAAEKDGVLYSYTIPEGTLLMPNLYSVNMDPKVWKNPEEFRPERWMKDGKFLKHKNLLSFSMGPRVCLGENLAKDELFLFLAMLLQRFRFDFAHKKHSKILPQAEIGVTACPPDYEMIAEMRIK